MSRLIKKIVKISIFGISCILLMNFAVLLPQHEEGMGLIEDNEINNNTLAGVWITTGKWNWIQISLMCNNYCSHCSVIGYTAHAQSNRMFKNFLIKFFMLFVSSFVKLGSAPTLRHNRIHSGKQVKFIQFCFQFVSKRLRILVYCQNTLITMFWDQDLYWNSLPDFVMYRFRQA